MNFKATTAAANNCGATFSSAKPMESGDHLKNGAISKSHTSRRNFLNKIGIAMLAAAVVFGSCSKDKNNSQLAKLDIKGAASLFIAPSGSGGTRSTTDGVNRLFKISDDGVIQEVSYLDEDGNQIEETLVPEMMYFIDNSDYFVAVFRNPNGIGSYYLVRKSDGAVFVLETTGIVVSQSSRTGGFRNSEIIVQDASKNLYFYASRVFKLDVSNPNSLTSEPVTPDTEIPYNFTVSANGDVFYSPMPIGVGHWSSPRVRKSNGGLFNVPGENHLYNSWTGLDGKIRFLGQQKTNNETYITEYPLITVNIDSSGDSVDEEILEDISVLYFQFYTHILRFNSRIVLLGNLHPNGVNILEIENASKTPRNIPAPAMSSFRIAISSNNFIYLSGNNASQQPVLFKINVATSEAKSLFTAGAYDIFAMTVSANDELTFNALRMSDGKKIIGTISSSEELKIIDEQLNSEVVVLERIQ